MDNRTRSDFFQSVKAADQDYPVMLTHFFDQFSVLYNIIGRYDNLMVSKDPSQNFTFTITAPNLGTAQRIVEDIAYNSSMTIYDRTFMIQVQQLSDLVLKITIT